MALSLGLLLRAGVALVLAVAVWSLETGRRPAITSAATAAPAPSLSPASSPDPTGRNASEPSERGRWVSVARGTIPMPAGLPSAHASALVVMPQSDAAAITAFWFAGDRESAPNVQIAVAQFDRARQAWGPARIVLNRHVAGAHLGFGLRRLGNPVAWIDAQQRMHLFVVATGWGGWAASRILHMQQVAGSSGETLRFKPVRGLPLAWMWNLSYLVRTAPLQLADGGMVLPAYFELGAKFPVALRFDRSGEFLGIVRISGQTNMLQPALLATSPSDWLALMRDTRAQGKIRVAQTQDAGQSWRDAPDLPLDNPDAGIATLSVGDQHLLAFNPSTSSRQSLRLASSGDGRKWTTALELESGLVGQEFSYPALAWSDQSLWVSYTDQRQSIAWQQLRWKALP